MSIAALSHGYPPLWNMGGEVSLHRTMKALNGEKFVLTATEEPYEIDGVSVKKIDTPDVLDINADPKPIAEQLKKLNAKVVIGQNELSLPAVYAAQEANAISVVSVHTPPKYGKGIAKAMQLTDYAIYNTHTSAKQWGEPRAFVVHPPISPMPTNFNANGDAYTILSSLVNKGVEVVLEMARRFPDKRFIIVRSPAEPTHGLANLEARAAKLPNVELHPRVAPEEVYKYLEQTKVLLVPSRYETYGMSAIEAAGYGIPSIHVDTPHVREGIGSAAVLVPPLGIYECLRAVIQIDKNYEVYSQKARSRAEWLHERQEDELERLARFMDNLKTVNKPTDPQNKMRRDLVTKAMSKYNLL